MIKHLLAGGFFFLSLAVLLVAQTFTGVSLIGVRLGAQGGGDVVGPSSSVNGQVATFSGTTGKLLAAFTGTGIYRFSSGVPSLITQGTDGNCVSWSTSGGLSDAGAPCGSGGGATYSAGDGIGISGTTISVDTTVPALVADGSQSMTFGTISSGTISTQTLTVSGVSVGDRVTMGWPSSLPDGLIPFAYVSATDTITVKLYKATSGSASVTGLTFYYQVQRIR